MQDARLDWLAEDIDAFFPQDRTLKKATLPCSHSFAATPLAYHFLKNGMRCPVCRAGEDNQLDARGIPVPLRGALLARVRETAAVEAEQQRAEDHEATVQEIQRVLVGELLLMHTPFVGGRFPDSVSLCVSLPGYWLTLALWRDSEDATTYTLPRTRTRELSRFLRDAEVAWFTMAIRWQSMHISSVPSVQLPCAIGAPPAWEHSNRVLFHDVDAQTFDIFTHSPSSNERQRSRLRVRHSLHECAADDAFFPFTSMQWRPDEGDLLQFVHTHYDELE